MVKKPIAVLQFLERELARLVMLGLVLGNLSVPSEDSYLSFEVSAG
jgi:hypothetical protein